ncbi:MAG: hypothetical protein ACNA7V_12845 [Bacteroidales bacterium]
MWSFDPNEQVNESYFAKRISEALTRRVFSGILEHTNAYRLINAESDGLPGLIVDHYHNILVCQFLSTGAEFFKKEIIQQLWELIHPESHYLKGFVCRIWRR